MRAITVSDRDAGVTDLSLTDLPYPIASENDVVVRVHAAGFTPGELDWPDTWTDRAGRDRTPSVDCHACTRASTRSSPRLPHSRRSSSAWRKSTTGKTADF